MAFGEFLEPYDLNLYLQETVSRGKGYSNILKTVITNKVILIIGLYDDSMIRTYELCTGLKHYKTKQ